VHKSLRTLRLMIAISMRADRARSIAALVSSSLQLIVLPLGALAMKLIADGLVVHDSRRAWTGVGILIGLMFVNRVMAAVSLTVRMRLRENTQLYLDTYLMDLTAGIPGIAHHELPEYLDRVEMLRAERNYLANPFNPISWSLASMLQAISAIVLLASIQPLLALVVVAAIPGAILSVRSYQRSVSLLESQAEDNRVLRHLFDLSTQPGPAKELRLYTLAGEILERRRQLFDRLEQARIRNAIGATATASLAWAFFAACYCIALGATVQLARNGHATVGAVVLVLSIGMQLSGQLNDLAFHVSWFVHTHRAVGRLLWFREYADGAKAALAPAQPLPVPDRLGVGIRLEGISFTYPGTARCVLESIDLELPAGTSVAIVGENGSGKTTLVKLLTRLYEPTAGRILIDGVDLRRFDVAEWRDRTSAGFQDFGRFEFIARESIGIGDLPEADSEPNVQAALTRAAAAALPSELPDGLQTQLGREFDGGVDLSVGQWQKVALARAMMRPSPLLLILDEPTASLDAPTEHTLFEQFSAAARDVAAGTGAITVLVSHRFSTVRMADVILVVGDGKITESGSHDELIRAGGLYAELYDLQAAAYR
jgi:ATP-binding cassette subfamily B protein